MNKTDIKNFIFQAVNQVTIVLIPLITMPYLSRVLGKRGLGIYAYSFSIISYFVLFVLLGLNNYGNREIAKCKNQKELSNKFISIFLMQIVMGLITCSIYLTYCILTQSDFIFYIQGIYLLSQVFNINWFYFGVSDFVVTTIRNLVVKIFTLILILLFVKSSNDLYIYAWIMSLGSLGSQVVLFPRLYKYIKLCKVKFVDILKHIRPNIKLFIPVLAINMYTNTDKIMLGVFSTYEQVAFYENSYKIIQIPILIISSMGIVMMPKLSNLVANGQINDSIKSIKDSINIITIFNSVLFFEFIICAKEFVILFFGRDYAYCGELISFLMISTFFMAISNVIRTQYLIPFEKDKIFITASIIGAMINVILNYFLIFSYNAMGAVIATIICEAVICIYQLFYFRKEISNKTIINIKTIPYFILGMINYIICNSLYSTNIVLSFLIKFVLSVLIYITGIIVINRTKIKKLLLKKCCK